MALRDLLNITKQDKIGISEERIEAIKPALRQYIAFWREYPDLFVDFLQTGGDPTRPKKLNFYFYQRVFLRVAVRYRQVYAVFPRGYSKSFLAVLSLMVRCVLYPRAKLFTSAGGKSQSASILKEKVDEICQMVPAFEREIDRRPGKTVQTKDKCVFRFKNESYFDNVAANEKARGGRRHAGVLEECVGIDGKILQEVLIPMMSISRQCLDGTKQLDETLNKAQLYITTAGYKGTFPYDKLIQTLVKMITEPGSAFVLGGTYKIPVLTGQYEKTFVQDQKRDDTFNEAAFGREYESKWSGSAEDAFFNGEAFDRNRVLQKPEYEYSGRSTDKSYYVISVDVGRKGCDSVATIIKVVPHAGNTSWKSIVNIQTYSDTHFEDQAIKLKKLYYQYKARRLVIDANGLGIGLIDYMIKPQTDPDTGDVFPDFGVYNDEEGYYKKYRTINTEQEAMYLIKANAPLNTEAHSNVQVQLQAGKIKFLIDERTAKAKLLNTKMGQNMRPEDRAEYLKPYVLTSILKEEMNNLREENEGVNIILKQANRAIKKDKFSSFEYGLYYIKQEEDKRKKKKRFNAKDWMLMN